MSTKPFTNEEPTSVSVLSSNNIEPSYLSTTTQMNSMDPSSTSSSSSSSSNSEARRRNNNNNNNNNNKTDNEFVVTVGGSRSSSLLFPKEMGRRASSKIIQALSARLPQRSSPKEKIAIASIAALLVVFALCLSMTISFSEKFKPTPLQVESGIILMGIIVYFTLRHFGYICPPVRELSYIALFFTFYDFVRAFSLASPDIALRNAKIVVEIEKITMLFVEPWLQTIALSISPIIHFFNYFYIVAHWSSVFVFFVWLFLADKNQKILERRQYATDPKEPGSYERSTFGFYRNAFILTNMIAVTSFYLYPCAPPRMLPEYGFVDTMLRHSKIEVYKDAKTWMNPFAAMPSLHFGYSFLFAFCFSRTTRFNFIPFIYPVFMLLAIVCTGNHFILDAVAGGTIAISSIYIMSRLYDYVEEKQQLKRHYLPTVVDKQDASI